MLYTNSPSAHRNVTVCPSASNIQECFINFPFPETDMLSHQTTTPKTLRKSRTSTKSTCPSQRARALSLPGAMTGSLGFLNETATEVRNKVLRSYAILVRPSPCAAFQQRMVGLQEGYVVETHMNSAKCSWGTASWPLCYPFELSFIV